MVHVTKTPCNNKYQARDRYLEGADEILDGVLSFQNQANDTARSYPYALLHFLRPIQIHATDVLAVRREQLKRGSIVSLVLKRTVFAQNFAQYNV